MRKERRWYVRTDALSDGVEVRIRNDYTLGWRGHSFKFIELNFLDKLRGVTLKQKVKEAIEKAQRTCDSFNRLEEENKKKMEKNEKMVKGVEKMLKELEGGSKNNAS